MTTHQNFEFCPYKGLQPFTAEDKAFFFGREKERDIIASNLEVAPITVFYGASGVGKTSVLMAGVVPQLQGERGAVVVFFRDWHTADFISALKKAVLEAVSAKVGSEVKVDDSQTFADFLLKCTQALHSPILFIFDQFEEYFLYHNSPTANGNQGKGRQGKTHQEHFDVELARAINRRDLRVNFLFSMREDSLSKLDRLQRRIPNLLGNMLRLEYLDRNAARAAVKKPLDAYDEMRPGQKPVKVEQLLVEKLLDQVLAGKVTIDEKAQVEVKPDSVESEQRIETPFLQMVLERLWDKERQRWQQDKNADAHWLRLATLEELGGAKHIVRTHLDEVMERLGELARSRDISITPEEALAMAGAIFRFLVTPSETKIAHSASDLASFAELPPGKEKQLEEVLKLLASPSVRILREVRPVPGKDSGMRYEIYHDVLAPAILDWRMRYVKDQKILEAERRAIEQRRRAEKEAKNAARLFWLVIALAIVSILAVGFGFYSLNLRAQAETLKEQALIAEGKAKADRERVEAIERQLKESEQRANEVIALSNVQIEEATRQSQIAVKNREDADRAAAKLIAAQQALEKERIAKEKEMGEKAAARSINDIYQDAEMIYQSGETEKAIARYKETLPLFDQLRDSHGKAGVFFTVGLRYRELLLKPGAANEDADEEDTNTPLTEPQEVDEKKIEAVRKDALEQAQKNFQQAYEIYQEEGTRTNDRFREAATLSTLGSIYEKTADEKFADAEAHLKKAVYYYDTALPLYMMARDSLKKVLSTLEKLAKLSAEFDKGRALVYYRQLRTLYHQNNNLGKEAATLRSIGTIYYELGEKDKAISAYTDALPLYRGTYNKVGEIFVLNKIGRIRAELGDKREAIEIFGQLLTFEAPVRDQNRRLLNGQMTRAGWHATIAGFYDDVGAKQMALEYYGRARDLLRSGYIDKSGKIINTPSREVYQEYEADVLKAIGKIYLDLRDKAKAIEAYSQAQQLYRESEIPAAESDVLNHLGKIYESLGEQQKAAEFYQRAKELKKPER